MGSKTDCTNPEGHEYLVNGHVAKCQHKKCGKVQTYNPVTRKWENTK